MVGKEDSEVVGHYASSLTLELKLMCIAFCRRECDIFLTTAFFIEGPRELTGT